MSSKNNIDEKSARGAYFTEAINQLLAAVDCPKSIRPFIDCLIGYADGRIEISIFDIELGRRTEPNRSEDAATKWVQRNRKKLVEWQKENDLILIECKSGFKDRYKRHIPSRYYIHLSNYVNRILEEAQKVLERRDVYQHVAIEMAAQNFVGEIITSPIKYKQRVGKTKDAAQDISIKFKQVITNIEKMSDLITRNPDIITQEHSKLWEALNIAISNLSVYFEDEDEEEDYYWDGE